jgi:uncharacterized coiled-coil protein SlyX
MITELEVMITELEVVVTELKVIITELKVVVTELEIVVTNLRSVEKTPNRMNYLDLLRAVVLAALRAGSWYKLMAAARRPRTTGSSLAWGLAT